MFRITPNSWDKFPSDLEDLLSNLIKRGITRPIVIALANKESFMEELLKKKRLTFEPILRKGDSLAGFHLLIDHNHWVASYAVDAWVEAVTRHFLDHLRFSDAKSIELVRIMTSEEGCKKCGERQTWRYEVVTGCIKKCAICKNVFCTLHSTDQSTCGKCQTLN